MTDTFSVYLFFPDDTSEQVRRGVPDREAVEAAHHYCPCVGAKLGTTRRVIITDEDDFCVFEWKYGQGITWPTPADGLRPELYQNPQMR